MEVAVGFPHGSNLPRTSSAECFHLVPLLPPQPRHMATLRNWWKTALLIQGIEFPGLQATRGGPPKPWDSVQVTKILFFPPRVCPSSGKCKFYYRRQQATTQSRRSSSWKLSWSQRHNLCSAKPGPGILGLEWGAQACWGSLEPAGQAVWGSSVVRGSREGFSWGRNDPGGHGGSIHTVGLEGGHTWVVRG